MQNTKAMEEKGKAKAKGESKKKILRCLERSKELILPIMVGLSDSIRWIAVRTPIPLTST